MPVMDNPNFIVPPDSTITPQRVCFALSVMCVIEMESAGLICCPGVHVNLSAFEGMYYRSKRMKIATPDAESVIHCTRHFLEIIGAPDAEINDMLLIAWHKSLPDLMRRLEPPVPVKRTWRNVLAGLFRGTK